MNNIKKDITEEDIYKEAVTGFIVVNGGAGKGNYHHVYTEPICMWCDGLENNITIDKKHTIIGILQAPAGSYRVYGFGEDGNEIELGYEYPGAYHPDWVAELKARRKED
jgi:hypothetical protein